MSSQYSRYTTTKGQLLLNIKPPSNRNIKINTSNNNNNITSSPINQPKYVPYTGDNRYQTGSFGLNINNQNTMTIKDQTGQSGYHGQNQRQIYYPQRNQVVNSVGLNQRGNSNIYYQQSNSRHQYNPQLVTNTQHNYQTYNAIQPQPHYNQPTPPFVLNSTQNYAKINVQNNQRPLSQTKNSKLGSINAFDQQNTNNKRQQHHQKQVDSTVCCFPGYWLLLLLLAVLVGCFVLITLRNQQGLFSIPNNSTDTFAAANGNGANSTSAANNTGTNSGQTGISGNTTGISGNTSSSGSSSLPTSTTGTTTNSGSGTSSTSGSTNISGGASNGTSTNSAGTSSTTSTTNINTSFQFPTPTSSTTPATTTTTTTATSNTNTSPSSPTTSFMFPPSVHHLQLRHQINPVQKQTKIHTLLPL